MDLRGLYAITPDWPDSLRIFAAVEAALRGGAAALQLRRKQTSCDQLREEGMQIAVLCRQAGVPFIVNDDAVLAKQLGADGVHLGRDDGDIAAARALLGPGLCIGVSCYADPQKALSAQWAGADYVAIGSIFPSSTKPDAAVASLDTLRDARSAVDLPVVAIGGITLANAARVRAAGADMAAVISAVFDAPDVEAAARQFSQVWKEIHVQNK